MSTYTIAHIAPTKPHYPNSFVDLHRTRMPAEVLFIHGLPKRGYCPIYDGDGRPLSSDSKLVNYFETGFDIVTGRRNRGYHFRLKALGNYLRENSVDAVLTEHGPTATYVVDVCKSLGIPLVSHFHGKDAHHHKTVKRFLRGYGEVFEYAHRIIGVSTGMVERLVELGAPREKVIYNPLGPNEDAFELHNIAGNPVTFVTTGRFVAKKAPQNVIKAFAKVQSEIPDARLIMIGDGGLLKESKFLAEKLGVEANIDFKGRVPNEEIDSIYASCIAYVQHSVVTPEGDSEGTPCVILEAMLSGLPVVATRHAGIADVVLDGQTGFLVPEHDVDGMADKMIEIALNPSRGVKMGQAGHDRVEAEFSLDKHMSILWGAIESAIRSGQQA